MIGPETLADAKHRMLSWHRACMYWALRVGDLPEWARDLSGRDASLEDAARLERETDHRMFFGTTDPGNQLLGILDFTPPSYAVLPRTRDKWPLHGAPLPDQAVAWPGRTIPAL